MDAQNSSDELYPIAVLIDELKVGNPPPGLMLCSGVGWVGVGVGCMRSIGGLIVFVLSR